SKGVIPLNVDAVADVKIASEPEHVFHNAVERLLGKTEKEVAQLARDTLTGSLRGVVSQLTPEQVNEDRIRFAEEVNADASNDLEALGFKLDVLKIQNVSDDKGYLDAIGRERAAIAIKDAERAEAENEAEAREAQELSRQRQEVAEAEANIEIAEADARYRVRQAELDEKSETAERTARVKAEQAEVEAQRELEKARVAREEESYRADVVVPARAEREAAEEKAKADAAPIRERGKAQAEALDLVIAQVRKGESTGVRVFTLEKLVEMLPTAIQAVDGIDIDRLVVVDSGDGGDGVTRAATSRMDAAFGSIEHLLASLGSDPERLLRRLVGGDADEPVSASGASGAAGTSGSGGDGDSEVITGEEVE
ncbi:MAG: SPFH domain-containing protein, partial [bacterium]